MASPTTWQFLNTGFNSGFDNMQCDENLVLQLQEGSIPQTVRVYGWKPFAISLGYHQQMKDIDEKKCAERGIDIVRRTTGGRAILHADEVTYSVVMFANGKSLSELYHHINTALVHGLTSLGANIELAATQPNFSLLYKQRTSIPCFTSSARYEIQSNGKKLVGSAQRRFAEQGKPEIILQHGSILLNTTHRLLNECIRTDDAALIETLQHEMEEKTTDLSTILQRNVNFDEIVTAVRNGFEKQWNISFQETAVMQ